MGSILSPQSAPNKGEIDFIRYLKKNPVDNDNLLEEIKNTSIKNLKDLSPILDKAMTSDNICVFGNRDQILEIKSDFDKVIDLNN